MSTFFSLQNTTKKEDEQKNKINKDKQKGEKKKPRYAVSRYAVTLLPVTPLRVLLTINPLSVNSRKTCYLNFFFCPFISDGSSSNFLSF